MCFKAFALFLISAAWLQAARYALLLDDPGAAVPRSQLASASVQRTRVASAQAALRRNLFGRAIPVTGSVQNLVNAVFVEANPGQLAALQSLPGVRAVVSLRVRHPHLDRAAGLINAPAAWTSLGGIPNAGLGLKIGIIDTGIDQNHPGFNDPTLPAQPHICSGADCAFTNNKVIVARSYVRRLGAGTGPEPAANSRPDDFSPRDRVGHGTAVAMVAAGNTNTGPNGTITGIAPKAYLGNYKVYGSNGLNSGATDDVLIQAIEDAFQDGMDVVNLSSGAFPFSGALDTGAICGNQAGAACDLLAVTFEAAVRNGMVVVVSAGNEGEAGLQAPTLATVNSPSTAPGVISVAASTNSHYFLNGIFVTGVGVPASLASIAAEYGDGPVPDSPITARLKDASAAGDAQACKALPAGSLAGQIAIIVRSSNCRFLVKIQNAQAAGAVAVIFSLASAADDLFTFSGLTGTSIPAVLIGQADGQTLRTYASTHPEATATLDLSFLVSRETVPDQIAFFSSRGPTLNSNAVKPEITAVGTDIYMAAQRYDPTGDLYSPSGYAAASGTSFASPMVAGAAALVKQKHREWKPAQIKSALVNSTVANVLLDANSPAPISAQGSGKLNVAAAVNATVTLAPATVSFGALSEQNPPRAVPIQVTNNGSAAVSLNATAPAPLIITGGQLALQPGQTANFSIGLPAAIPAPGSYSGQVTLSGAPGALHLPYTYAVGDGFAYNALVLAGDGGIGNVGDTVPDGLIAFQVTDQFGLPVANAPVTFGVSRGGGSVSGEDAVTNTFGIARAVATLGPVPGLNLYIGRVAGLIVQFSNDGRARPTIEPTGIVNAASSLLANGIVPGSYISLYGTALSDTTALATTASLPLTLANVSVSFDTQTVSAPGRLYYVSPSQVNVQVPWEIAGKTAVQIKVSIDQASGTLVTVPVASASPAIFVYGQAQAAALDENSALIGPANPARRGRVISLFANALGPVSNQPTTGEPAPSSPLATTLAVPLVMVGNLPATVLFSGLAPGFSGLYQINVQVPANSLVGPQPVTVATGGVTSPVAQILVQ